MSLQPGQVFAGYTILRELGSGGMGQVYLAAHPRLARQDAVKVLPTGVTADPQYRERFEREAELAAGLSHPHILGIHDRGEHDGQFWISMDYVAGTDVARLLRDRFPAGMPAEEAMAIVAAVASALDYAHRRGVLHRDVKPANILIADADGQGRRVYLADFGVARRADDVTGPTTTNMAVGTVAYAAPEQLMGRAVDGRADQYALACTAFHLFAGAPPYGGSSPAVVIGQHVGAAPPSIGVRRPELAGLDPVFATAMAKEPSARYGSCGEFARQLSEHLAGPPEGLTAPALSQPPLAARKRSGRRPAVLVGAILAVALLAGAGVFPALRLTDRHQPAPPAGPFTGTYRAEFGPIVALDDAAEPGGTPALTSTYGLRSVCRSSGCVMTAARVGGATVGPPALVFDEIGGRWVAVALGQDSCRNADAEFWQVFTLQPRPDGTLAGEYIATSGNACADKRTVILTRTGDTDANTIADPSGLPARVASPAQALRGHYRVTRTFTNGLPQQQLNTAVVTECLRTSERCMSYFHEPSGDLPLVYGGGSWTWNIDVDIRCARSTDTAHLTSTGQAPLPQPPRDPIAQLVGHGHQQQTEPCAMNADYDETITRTGD